MKSILTLRLNRKLLFALTVCFTFQVSAQDSNDRAMIRKNTNVQALNSIIQQKSSEFSRQRSNARSDIPMERVNSEGQLGVLYSFDEKGNPVYAYDDNVDAAISGRTNKIWVGGSSGLNLTGAGIEIGVWESGKARPTHREFGGRATSGDGASVTSHGTHTGGTLIASGIDPAARGMATGASIKNYTASGMVSEAAAFAAAGGILANNSNSPSGTPGEYDANARDMDNVTYNAPFYLHCKSAGNNGSPYGSIYGNQLAKNLLVVANSNDVPNYTGPSSVTLSNSSSYGPPDDWRIKPDITNNGVGVYSSDSGSDTDYGTKSGTSMSTPATTGSIALLQEHYKNLNGVYMRAATAKALVINTADEVGANDGPDFRSGWGLVNSERAAQVITDNGSAALMDELVLNNGETYTTTIISDGSTPLALTVAWNDPAGPLNTGNSPVLVNDLDVRVSGNGNTYSPWVMVPNANFNNYTAPAQKGDNPRDNVEKIDAAPPAGTYTVTVTHKGTLQSGSQAFSLVVSGVTLVPDNEAPSTPTNLTVSNVSSTSADLSWTASTDNVKVVAYDIFQGTTKVGASATTNFSVTGLTPETAYSFTVQARDAAKNVSGSSNAVSFTTLPPPPCAGITSFPYSESFETNLGAWTQLTNDNLNWRRDSGGTPSSNTGPSNAADGTFYLYIESSSNGTGYPNKVATIESPCIDLSSLTSAALNFDYHMYGSAMGTLEVLVSVDEGNTYSTLWSKTGNQGNTWNQAEVSLDTYIGGVIQLQFKGTTGSSYTSDITIDHVEITSLPTATQALRSSETEKGTEPSQTLNDDVDISEEISSYPNPFSGQLHITYHESWSGGTLSILNLNGAVLFQAKLKDDEKMTVIDPKLNEGFYLLTITNGDMTYRTKLVKK